VFDDGVCFAFWRNELWKARWECARFIEVYQKGTGMQFAYSELIELERRWQARPRKINGVRMKMRPPPIQDTSR
jgi:hypothetical protein